jgi:hypothetical protein
MEAQIKKDKLMQAALGNKIELRIISKNMDQYTTRFYLSDLILDHDDGFGVYKNLKNCV